MPMHPPRFGCAHSDAYAGSRQYRNRHSRHDGAPVAPQVELRKIVRPHDPNKAHPRAARLKSSNRTGGMGRAYLGLNIADAHLGMADKAPRRRHALGKGCGAMRFQGVGWAHQPPQLRQPKPLERLDA